MGVASNRGAKKIPCFGIGKTPIRHLKSFRDSQCFSGYSDRWVICNTSPRFDQIRDIFGPPDMNSAEFQDFLT